MTSTGDFGINCIFSWLPFVVSPSVFTFLVSMILSFACFGISYSVPTLGESAASVKGFMPKFILTVTVLCTVSISTVALNASMSMINFDFSMADINLWFLVIPGNVVISYMMMFLAIVLAINNGLRPFMLKKAEGN
jgi:hypothetical protein